MSPFLAMIACTTCAGLCILLGGLVARIERIRPLWLETEFRHSVIAFGGGVLVAAVALVLVPEGTQFVRSAPIATGLVLAGGLFFLFAERQLALRRRESPQFLAMLLDYVPESIALGGMFALEAPGAILLAILVGLQNLPEGFNAFRELKALPGFSAGRSLLLMAVLIPLGPIAGTIGWTVGPGHPVALGSVMLFAAGGILYLLFQDIAPQSRLDRHWGPTLGAVVGFCLGMLGSLLIA